MAKTRWAAFAPPNKAFDYSGDKLSKAWTKLHSADQEPLPDETHVAGVLKTHPKLGKATAAGPIATQLQDAWRAFHRGDFQDAYDSGSALGAIGASVAIKAAGIHATYLLEDDKEKEARYLALAKLAEDAVAQLPDEANSHYRRAFALGRYSQSISIAKALSQGLAGKVKEALDRSLKLAPAHAEAHTALGLYHAEIIAKVGSMIGGLTYGAKSATGEEHLKTALELAPDSPIAWIEYGNGLLLLFGAKREDDAAEAYDRATRIKPKDAMEALDVAHAQAQLE